MWRSLAVMPWITVHRMLVFCQLFFLMPGSDHNIFLSANMYCVISSDYWVLNSRCHWKGSSYDWLPGARRSTNMASEACMILAVLCSDHIKYANLSWDEAGCHPWWHTTWHERIDCVSDTHSNHPKSYIFLGYNQVDIVTVCLWHYSQFLQGKRFFPVERT